MGDRMGKGCLKVGVKTNPKLAGGLIKFARCISHRSHANLDEGE